MARWVPSRRSNAMPGSHAWNRVSCTNRNSTRCTLFEASARTTPNPQRNPDTQFIIAVGELIIIERYVMRWLRCEHSMADLGRDRPLATPDEVFSVPD